MKQPEPQGELANEDENRSVQPKWCRSLSIQQQSVLLLGARGPDGIAKAHPCKRIQRAYRGSVLVAARYGRCLEWGEQADTFMSLDDIANNALWETIVSDFFHYADDLPHHFYMHLIHGAEILGYKHPEARYRERWSNFYFRCVKEFHLTPETELQMDSRLSDWGKLHWRSSEGVLREVSETELLRAASECSLDAGIGIGRAEAATKLLKIKTSLDTLHRISGHVADFQTDKCLICYVIEALSSEGDKREVQKEKQS